MRGMMMVLFVVPAMWLSGCGGNDCTCEECETAIDACEDDACETAALALCDSADTAAAAR